MRLAAVHLVDCSYLYDKNRFLSALMLSLTAIIGMEMPFINAISKVDLMRRLGRPDMNLTFYSEISGLKYLFCDEEENQTPFQKRFGKLTSEICSIVENFNLVQYTMIDIHNRLSICSILMRIDESNGYFHDPQKLSNPKEMEIDYESLRDYQEHEAIMDIEEKYLDEEENDEGKDDVEMK